MGLEIRDGADPFAFGIGLVVWRTSRSRRRPAPRLSAPFMGFFAYRYCHAAFFSLATRRGSWRRGSKVRGPGPCVTRRSFRSSDISQLVELNSGTAKEMSALLIFMNVAGG